MSIVAKHLAIVKEHIAIQNRLAQRYAKDERRMAMHVASRDGFVALLEAITEADTQLDACQGRPLASMPGPILVLRPEELDGLPQELLDELSEGAIPDKADSALIAAIDERGGIATLDQIMVGLYRATKEVIKRTTLTSKLYRMNQKGSIFPVPGRKGLYSTKRLTEEDAKRILGTEQETQQALI